jgi:hypothetical protein
MRKILVFLSVAAAGAAFSLPAQAQIKCWNDANGKRVCGDAPPPGAKVTTLKGPSGPADPAPGAAAKDGKGGKDADKKKGPLTPAEQEQEYRKRQQESQKSAAKADEQRKEAEAKRENCERSREVIRTLESGQRVGRIDSKGERYYLDEQQTAQELAAARERARANCS